LRSLGFKQQELRPIRKLKEQKQRKEELGAEETGERSRVARCANLFKKGMGIELELFVYIVSEIGVGEISE